MNVICCICICVESCIRVHATAEIQGTIPYLSIVFLSVQKMSVYEFVYCLNGRSD